MTSLITSSSQKSTAASRAEGDNALSLTDQVIVMLCTYNGERYLAEQLNSIERQTHSNWSVIVSDDGSSDSTLDIIQNYQHRWGNERLSHVKGPQKGFARNFMSVLCNLDTVSKYYSWSDQDDVWLEAKIERALDWLRTVPEDIPALYCGRTESVTDDGRSIGYSPLFTRPPGFANALVQSIGGGNTMIFNHAAYKVLKTVGCDFPIVSHDWWAYLVISGVGGTVHYDTTSYVRYRQHDGNLVGANATISARVRRLRMILSGRFSTWNQQNIAALESMEALLSERNRIVLQNFKKARAGNIFKRLIYLQRSGVYRQTFLGNCTLILAGLSNGV